MALTNASFRAKEKMNLPAKAKILSKKVTLDVEEIENGFLVCKCSDIRYQVGDNTEYCYHTKKWFAKENPLEIDMDSFEELSLADKFD